MYVMYVRIYVFMHVCMSVCVYDVCTCACVYVYMIYVCVHACYMHTHMDVVVCIARAANSHKHPYCILIRGPIHMLVSTSVCYAHSAPITRSVLSESHSVLSRSNTTSRGLYALAGTLSI
jgi:hypothetical protein